MSEILLHDVRPYGASAVDMRLRDGRIDAVGPSLAVASSTTVIDGGGMLALPSGPWAEGAPEGTPPLAADWRDLGVEVRHTFTHFHLRLTLAGARVAAGPGDFRPAAEAGPAMPTLMRKALRLGLAAMDAGGGG